MKTNEKRCRNIVFISVCVAFLLQILYLYNATENVPIMDYWKYINKFINPFFQGKLTFGDIWEGMGIHRTPLQFIFFLLNVKFFHMNSQVEIYAGAAVQAIMIVLLIYWIDKTVLREQRNVGKLLIISSVISLVVYNGNQWEMLSLQFGLSFAARMISFVMCFIFTDNFLLQNQKSVKSSVLVGILYGWTICAVGAGYFPCLVLAGAGIGCLHLILNYKNEKFKYMKSYLTICGLILVAVFVYMYGVDISKVNGNMELSVSTAEMVKNLLPNLCIMLAASVFGINFGNTEHFYIIGACILTLYIFSLIIYFKRKYYKQTYLPCMFYTYSFFSCFEIFYGRGDLGREYLLSSRYVCESNIAILAFAIIAIMYFLDEEIIKTWKRTVMYLAFGIVVLCVMCSSIVEFSIAKYRKQYDGNLVLMMKNIDNYTREELLVFQGASNPDDNEALVKSGINIMKKYELGIYWRGEND